MNPCKGLDQGASPVKALLKRLCFGWGLILTTAAAAPVAAQSPVPEKFVETPATVETLRDLRGGGFTLFLRHGPTDNSRPDRMPQVDVNDCSTQRPLTEDGRMTAVRLGGYLKQLAIPIGAIHSSPLCRARETAVAAFPESQAVIVEPNLIYTANMTASQKLPILEETRRLLSTPVPPGSNRLVIAHGPNLMDLIGYFPKEATLVIFRPLGGGFMDYVASIPVSRWPELME